MLVLRPSLHKFSVSFCRVYTLSKQFTFHCWASTVRNSGIIQAKLGVKLALAEFVKAPKSCPWSPAQHSFVTVVSILYWRRNLLRLFLGVFRETYMFLNSSCVLTCLSKHRKWTAISWICASVSENCSEVHTAEFSSICILMQLYFLHRKLIVGRSCFIHILTRKLYRWGVY